MCIASGPGNDMFESTKIIAERQYRYNIVVNIVVNIGVDVYSEEKMNCQGGT